MRQARYFGFRVENREGVRVTLERLAEDFIWRTMGSHGEVLRGRGGTTSSCYIA